MPTYDLNKTIKEALFNYDNIKQYYDPKDPDHYKYELFRINEETLIINYNNFVNHIKRQGYHHFEVLYRLLPLIFEDGKEHDINAYIVEWIIQGNNSLVFGTYAVYFCENISQKDKDYIEDIYNNTTAKKIAISKLQRNRIVNEGILLKLSMKNCGLF